MGRAEEKALPVVLQMEGSAVQRFQLRTASKQLVEVLRVELPMGVRVIGSSPGVDPQTLQSLDQLCCLFSRSDNLPMN